jgi:hypothetical protein
MDLWNWSRGWKPDGTGSGLYPLTGFGINLRVLHPQSYIPCLSLIDGQLYPSEGPIVRGCYVLTCNSAFPELIREEPWLRQRERYWVVEQQLTLIARGCTTFLCSRSDSWTLWYEIEVFAAVKITTIVFWVMTPCSLVGGHQRFGGIYCLHLQVDGCSISSKVLVTPYQMTRHNPEDRDVEEDYIGPGGLIFWCQLCVGFHFPVTVFAISRLFDRHS